MKKKLYRSSGNRMVAGVCAGLAEYLDIDVNIVRLIWVAVALLGGTGVLLYLIAAVILPSDGL